MKEEWLQIRLSCLLCHCIVLSELQEYASWSGKVRIGLGAGRGVLIPGNEEKSSYREKIKSPWS